MENLRRDFCVTNVEQSNKKRDSNNGTKPLQNRHISSIKDVSAHIKAISTLLFVLLKLESVLYVPLFIYRAFQKAEKVPPVDDEILKLPASVLTEKIRNQEVTCEDAIKRYISRIKQVNPLINAVVGDRFDAALEEARKVDEMIRNLKTEDICKWERLPEEYPLLGVPLTVKGSLDVKGLKNTSGMVIRTEICQKDADSVDLAKKAGAIPLLTSNVPELCMNWETCNKVIGTTRNPHNTLRTSGGSSGGEASLLGAGASLIGIGSDVAGSLRLPAHYCGVLGHKPTPKVVSAEGHYPSCSNFERWNEVFAVGPMARYATDLKILLKVLCKEEFKARLKLDEKVNFKDLKLFYIDDLNSLLSEKVNDNCSKNLEKAVKHMESVCQASTKKLDIPLLKHAPYLASSDLLTIKGIDSLFKGDNCEGVYSEFFRFLTGRSKHTLMAILYGFLKKSHNKMSKNSKKEIDACVHEIKTTLIDTIGQNGILLMPCFPFEAHPHKDVMRKPFNSGFLSLFNAVGFPVTCCPVGRTPDGLPIGIQIVALPYNDNLTLEVARELERAFGGWVQPQ